MGLYSLENSGVFLFACITADVKMCRDSSCFYSDTHIHWVAFEHKADIMVLFLLLLLLFNYLHSINEFPILYLYFFGIVFLLSYIRADSVTDP
jgi:hypothetical protein